MIWNDRRIAEWAQTGGVTPYADDLVNPASLDLRLGNMIREPKQCWQTKSIGRAIDKRTPASDLWTDEFEFSEYVLKAGQCVLCHSLEYIRMPRHAAGMIASKSSTGRMLLEHFHSGWVDCAFMGNITFELKNDGLWDIVLRPGDLWLQMVMMGMMEEPDRDYSVTGRYQGQTGATPHRGTP